MKTKKTPLRTCIGCNETRDKSELVRIVKDKDNNIFLDKTGKSNGRGAYICKNNDCLDNAIRRKGFYRAFKMAVSDEDIANIREELLNMRGSEA